MRHAHVRVICFADTTDQRDDGKLDLKAVKASLSGRVVANLMSPSPMLPLQVRAFLDLNMHRAIRKEVLGWQPDVLHLTLSRMAPYMSSGRGYHRHLDLVDSMGLNMRARAEVSTPGMRAAFAVEAALVTRYEARMTAEADSASVVAELDQSQRGLRQAIVVPNGVDPTAFSYREPIDRPPHILFFGNLGYFHNVKPAVFLATEVLNRVRCIEPTARLVIAGSRPDPVIQRLAQRNDVSLIIDPAEMAPVLHGAAVVAIPMFSGSGMKNKVLEAFSAGTPVVANAAGIEGVSDVFADEHFVQAEGPEDTAAAVVRLLQDQAERVRLARAARTAVVDHYSWSHQADRMMRAYGISCRHA